MSGFQQMSDALGLLVKKIQQDYAAFSDPRNPIWYYERCKEFNDGIRFEEGRKYVKVITGTSVHSFICKGDDPKNGFKDGDILKAASWNAPAKNFARGNVFDRTFDRVRWTGVS